MAIPETTLELIERFESNRDAYQSSAYNETQLRREFLDPFFETLGWDMQNKLGYAEAYKDVIHEDAIKVGGFTKAPDYCFRIGGTRKFFVEAKKPSVNLKDDTSPAFQLRRYAWSAKLPLSILSDFEEFAVYDCRVKPVKTDKASTARILYLTFAQYPDKWDELASIFARDAILKGSFDKYVETTKRKKGTAEVDTAFLKEIETWRDNLARNLALRNLGLSQRELNYAVQTIIDRIIFLRICEDRGIEEYGRLMALQNGSKIYGRLFELFERADERYNSGLFHFCEEKGRDEPADRLTPGLTLDDKPLKDIIKNLYYPDSAYEFSVLPADILGQVYEQFLGKIIRLTAGHHAVVEDKPELKKAGGVYYTPTYIVEYIVKNTVGKLLEGKTPKQAAKLRILDPACGSGSFLIGAYQYLLDWHRDWYVEHGTAKHTKEVYQGHAGEWRLATNERKRILLNNIYGVDIDPQAVEVTKLSLLLKVLEGESDETLAAQLKLFHERALPDLGDNIKCGNSLVGPDYINNQQLSLTNEEEIYRINAFEWESEFSDIVSSGGFDTVIGNPPYVRIQTMKEWTPIEVELYRQKYISASIGNYDIYVVFVERGLSLLKHDGLLGFILPNKFFTSKYGQPLRELLATGKFLEHIVHFGDQQVFKGATTYTCLLFLDKAGNDDFRVSRPGDLVSWSISSHAEERSIPAGDVSGSDWYFFTGATSDLFERLKRMPIKLKDITERIFQGLVTGADPVFILTDLGDGIYFSDQTQNEHQLEDELMHTLCKGSVNIRRYHISDLTKSILFPYELLNGKAILLSTNELAEKYPNAWKYLQINRIKLESREHGKWKHERWYAFGRSQNLSEMEQRMILTPSIAKSASFTLDADGIYYFTGSGGGGGGGYGITLRESESLAYEYVLGLLNSRMLDLYLKSYSSRFSGGYYAYNRQYIEEIPIRSIDFSDLADKTSHDQMVKLVEMRLALAEQFFTCKSQDDKTRIQRQIDSTERLIDCLVYELYGLTDEEIRIVEQEQQ